MRSIAIALALTLPGLLGQVPVASETADRSVEISLSDTSGKPTATASAGLTPPSLTPPPAPLDTAGKESAAAPQALTDVPPAPLLLTAELKPGNFAVAGLTWKAGSGPVSGLTFELRVREAGTWSDWLSLEADGEGGKKAGTEAFITGAADAIQARVRGSGSLPPDLKLVVIPLERGTSSAPSPAAWPRDPGPAAAALAPAPAVPAAYVAEAAAPALAVPAAYVAEAAAPAQAVPAAAAPAPPIISRAGWKADPALLDWSPKYLPLRAAVIHHTAGTNNYTAAQSAQIVRNIYHYHSVTRGWGDIGYNFLIDKYGQIFEGRSGTLQSADSQMAIAAHAGGWGQGTPQYVNFNHYTMGISVMGDYTGGHPPQVVYDKMAQLISWKFGKAGLRASDPSGIISPGTPYTPAGINLPRIFVHRDVGRQTSTVCPGNFIHGYMPTLIKRVGAPASGEQLFTDIANSPFRAEIAWTTQRGIATGWPVEGTSQRVFRPTASVLRDQMAAFLYRLAGSPAFTPPARSPFTDLSPSSAFYKEITWLASKGIAKGWSNGDGTYRFGPYIPVLRDQMAAFLYRLAGRPAYTAPYYSPFKDLRWNTPFFKEMAWLHSVGVAGGWADGTYRPLNQISREQMAAFMYRFKAKF